MRRYRAKRANQRKKLNEQHALEKSRMKLAEIRREVEMSHDWEADGLQIDSVSSSDVDTQLEMELNPVATSEYSSNENTEEHALTLNDTDMLVEKLRSWANRHAPSHSCINDLLRILRLWFIQLPSRSRTLLGTKTNLKLEKVAGGDYYTYISATCSSFGT